MSNTQLPADWAEEIKQCAVRNIKTPGWGESVQIETGIACATEYATKQFQAQQEIESLTNQLKNHGKVSDENMKMLRQENEDKDLLIEMYNVRYNTARTLLQKFISRHEAGLLPDRFIYNEIKNFLDGK
jgi:hypothetical protein